MSDSCIVSLDLDVFDPQTFHNTASIEFWHKRAARYGNSANLSVFIEGTADDRHGYLRGLIATSITIFAVAFVWMAVLLTFKYIGPYGVGWWSGSEIPLPDSLNSSVRSHSDDIPHAKQSHRVDHRQATIDSAYRFRFVTRVIVLFCCVGIICSSILLSIKGVNSLVDSLGGIDETLQVAKGLVVGGIDLIDGILQKQQETVDQSDVTIETMNSMCPTVRDPICTNTTDVATCDFSGIFGANVENNTDVMEALVEIHGNTKAIISEELVKSREDLVDMLTVINDMGEIGGNFNWAFWCAMAFAMALSLACIAFIFVVIRPLTKANAGYFNCLLMPTFVLMVMISWVFSMAFVIGSIGLADLCYDSPDERFMQIVTKLQNEFSPLVYHMIIFYVSVSILREVSSNIGVDLSSDCDSSLGSTISGYTVELSDLFCFVSQLIVDLRAYLQCSNWFPLYEISIYDAMCYSGTEGFSWVTSTQIVIVFLSMVVLTFRIAFYDVEIEGAPVGENSIKEEEKVEDEAIMASEPEISLSNPEISASSHDHIVTPENNETSDEVKTVVSN
eukprot:Nitzschia sp. Nitz4//scaffold211_size37880//865//2887//NITZ4_007697-RA/size37880-augustus-gene-0.57-mRNA-1//-1//CDS//3329541952//8575//frame0